MMAYPTGESQGFDFLDHFSFWIRLTCRLAYLKQDAAVRRDFDVVLAVVRPAVLVQQEIADGLAAGEAEIGPFRRDEGGLWAVVSQADRHRAIKEGARPDFQPLLHRDTARR